jgi:hypothetical protein
MSVTVLGSSIVRTTCGVGDWVVWAVEQQAGIARVEERRGLTEVVVADAPRSVDQVEHGYAALACTVEGGLFVLTHEAPPALLLSPTGCRTTPVEPGGRELLALGASDRLLLMSSSVLDARPAALAKALHESSHELVRADPARLLGAIFREVKWGAGVVVGRSPGQSGEAG